MSIFEFKNTGNFLKKYILGLPKKGRGEVSRLARHLRVSSTLISQILAGDRCLTAEQAQVLISYFGFVGIEAEYFIFLNQFERAGSYELRKFWAHRLDEIKKQSMNLKNRLKSDKALSETEKAEFFSSAVYSVVSLYTSIGEKGKTLDEICARFELPRARVAGVLRFLVEIGYCLEKNGRYSLGTQKIHLEKGSPHLLKHHSNWRIHSLKHSENLGEDELMYTVPISISKTSFDKLREEMVKFIKNFLEEVHSCEPEELACLNLDFFWIK